jgi:hypothetical protein
MVQLADRQTQLAQEITIYQVQQPPGQSDTQQHIVRSPDDILPCLLTPASS